MPLAVLTQTLGSGVRELINQIKNPPRRWDLNLVGAEGLEPPTPSV